MAKRQWNCVHCASQSADGCTAWDCEYINRFDAIKAYKSIRHGTWQNATIDNVKYVECSVCGMLQKVPIGGEENHSWYYCPHCGAKMEQEKK